MKDLIEALRREKTEAVQAVRDYRAAISADISEGRTETELHRARQDRLKECELRVGRLNAQLKDMQQ